MLGFALFAGISLAQNLLAIDNLTDFSWRIAEIKWLSLCLPANLPCNKYFRTFAVDCGLALVCATNLPCTAKFNQNILVYFALNLRDFAVFARFAFTMSQFISQILCLAVV